MASSWRLRDGRELRAQPRTGHECERLQPSAHAIVSDTRKSSLVLITYSHTISLWRLSLRACRCPAGSSIGPAKTGGSDVD